MSAPSIKVVESSVAELAGKEFPFVDEQITIGRSDDCGVPLKDNRVSRQHARVERSPDGFRLRDLDSANGVFIDDNQVRDAVIKPGTRFKIADTLFELAAPAAAPSVKEEFEATLINIIAPVVAPVAPEAPPAEPPPPASEFFIRIAESKGGETVGKEFRIGGTTTFIGRSEECGVVLSDAGSSRRHARVEAIAPDSFKVIDNQSANGVWVGDKRITEEIVKSGQRFRIGDTFLECRYPTISKAGTAGTLIISDLAGLMAKVAAHRLESAGESLTLRGTKVVLLDEPWFMYYVVSGTVEIFTVTVKDGRPLGARNHFLTLKPGQAFFGMNTGLVQASGFLASGKTGTEVRRIPRQDVESVIADKNVATQVTQLADAWVTALASRLTRDVFPRPEVETRLEPDQPVTLVQGSRAKAAAGVLWNEIETDLVLFIGMSTVHTDQSGLMLPLTPQGWLEPASEQPVSLLPKTTAEVMAAGKLWDGLDLFHQTLSECEFINKRLAVVDEFQRLDSKARQSDAARDAAYDAIGAVLAGKNAEAEELTPSSDAEPTLHCCRLIGRSLGMKIKEPVEARHARTFDDQLQAIASSSRCRSRRVVIRGDWYLHDQGPFLARIEATNSPVALIPDGPRRYICVDPTAGTRSKVTAEIANSLAPFGYVFYRPFPPGKLTARDLLKFGAHGLRPDFTTLIAMGLITGLMGTITPFLTGMMVDSAIPQGDRSLLLQLGLGMLFTAFAAAAFKLTQSYAVVRVEGKMDYYLQGALWDRLLDLPSEFFRRYGAGDLAERAGGISTIRTLISRAGVTGILGSISSLAYVVMMFTYSFKLAGVAIAITAILVGVTTAGNYAQLKYQRVESGQRGAISSLVLQLITGISKVRVCAAENHAFRVWAQRFSAQRQTSFSIGSVQNAVGTISSSYSVLSSLGLFGALYFLKSTAGPNEPPPFTTGEFVAFNAAFGTFMAAMQALADASLSLLKTVPIYERLAPILEAVPETDEGKAHPGRLRGEIRISHLSFRYHPESPFILKDISITIGPGQFSAFVGGSGCGKSTLMRLLLGFEKPTMGSIYYDGQDLATLDTRVLRQQLGVVLQESRVLPTDIFRNIVGTTSHTMDEAWEAAEMAGLAEDVRAMPMGMHTVVSEGGGTFSGGQRQRLLISRALVNKPRIIYFDEATSALDNKTQAVVTQSMDRMDATRIVIAHRLSTVANADRIFYFDGGQVREEGSYDELMAKDGLFAALAKRQIA
jgi:NHLM bacteriocin system ABC transporter ATP-binding protein